MKKFLAITSRSLFVLVLLFCIFKSFTILADTTIFQIIKIEVKEKSEGVVVNDVSLSNGSLNNDIIFSAKDDFVKYNVTIKNNTSSDYTIKTITDNNESSYLEYTYDNLANTKVEGKSELTFELQIKYVNEASGLYISNEPVSLTLTYEKDDGTTSSETITDNTTPASDLSEETDIKNPNTGDNLNLYIIIGLISLAGLGFTFVNKKLYFKTLMLVSLFSILAIPFGAKADSEKFVITFNTNKIQNTSSDLISGPEFNIKIFKLASGFERVLHGDNNSYYQLVYMDGEYDYPLDTSIVTSLKCATASKYELIKDSLTDENIISTAESNNPAYMWFDDSTGTIYYYSDAKVLLTGKDSSLMFFSLGIDELDMSKFDTLNTTNMSHMFYSTNIPKINLGSNFDTSSVTNMLDMFRSITTINLNLGDKFDTSKVTNMSGMFDGATHLETLNLGSKFNTSKVTDMSFMFGMMNSLEELDLGDSFDTSNVTNMDSMFGSWDSEYQYSIKKLDLGDKFDTSNVTNMHYMFFGINSLEELDLGNKFDTSKVTDVAGMFNCMTRLKTIMVGDDFDLSSVEEDSFMFGYSEYLMGENATTYDINHKNSEYARIDDILNGKPGYFTHSSSDTSYGKLISGPEFNLKLNKLSTGNDNLEIISSEYEGVRYPQLVDTNTGSFFEYNYNVTAIMRASLDDLKNARSLLSLTNNNKISTNDSDRPIIAWFDDSSGIIYYYSTAKTLLVNEDASIMFNGFSSALSLDFGSAFDTSNVTNMFSMFGSMYDLRELDLGDNFDTSKVTNMISMFSGLQNISSLDLGDKFDTSNVIYMMDMFDSLFSSGRVLPSWELGDKFDTSKVTNMAYMFASIGVNKIDLGDKFNTSKVLNMEGMFADSGLVELDLGKHFDTSKVINMSYMFAESTLEAIYVSSDFDLSSLELDDEMFFDSYNLLGGSGTEYDYEHIDAEYARIDDPDNGKPGYFTLGDYSETVTQSKLISGPEINILIHRLSSGYEHLELVLEEQYGQNYYVYIDNVAGEEYYYSNQVYVFERANKRMYNSVKDSLTEVNVISTADSDYPAYLWRDDDSGIIYIYTQAKKLVLNENSSFMFFHLSSIEYIDMSIFDTSQVTDMSYMFSGDESLEEIYFGRNFNTSNVTNMSHMFEDTWLEELDLSSFDTSKVTDMSYMFSTNDNLQVLNLGNKFDTSNVTNMAYMFEEACVQEINLGDKFDTSSVINMEGMFVNTYGLEELNLGNNFNTSNVTNMSYMFSGSNLKSLDLGENFDTSNVTNMEGMFDFLLYLRTLDLGDKFDTSKVTNMSYMFGGGGDDWYSMEELILGDKFDTSNVTDMSYMFCNNRSLTELDLGDKFNTSKVTNMTYMFGLMGNLTTIYVANDFDLSSLEDENSGYYTFEASNLVGGSGTSYDYNNNDASYARIDDPEHDRPGYFTRRSN